MRALPIGAAAAACAALAAGCPQTPEQETLLLRGALEREGVEETSFERVEVRYASKSARGEWWSCDLRLTAGGCIGDHHVNAWISLPEVSGFGDLGQVACVDAEGTPFGAYELLSSYTRLGEPIVIGADVSVLLLVASDVDGDGAADLGDAAETTAASRLVEGSVAVLSIGSFDQPLTLTIDGTTADGNAVHLEMNGPTTPVPNPPTLDVARTCVARDLLER
jgi:hypothetical protein